MILQNPQRVPIALLGGGLNVVLVVFKPDIGPLCKAKILPGKQTQIPLPFEIIPFADDLLLCSTRECLNIPGTVGLKPDHNLTDPKSVISLVKRTFTICPSFCQIILLS